MDTRAQSIQIGAVLLFAIIIILLAVWQAVLVPNQNEKVEVDHYESAADDMTQIRSGIFEARTTGATQSETLKLGVEYPNRIVLRNPSAATGRLRTGPERSLSIEDQTGGGLDLVSRYSGVRDQSEVFTKLLSYRPSYNEFSSAGPIWYEHGVLYRDFRTVEGQDQVFLQNRNQYLVNNDSGQREVRIVPIQGDYEKEGIERVSIDPQPGILESEEVTDVNVTVPTRLSESRWESLLEAQLPADKIYVDESAEQLTLELDGTWNVQYAPVGVGGQPASGERGSGDNSINPASPGDVRFVEVVSRSGQNVTVAFNNSADTTINWTEARINFYDAQGNSPTTADIQKVGEDVSATLDIKGRFKLLDPEIPINPNGDQEVLLTFDQNTNPNDWFVLTVVFETGEQGTYFVAF
jgi:hypothetical protein